MINHFRVHHAPNFLPSEKRSRSVGYFQLTNTLPEIRPSERHVVIESVTKYDRRRLDISVRDTRV